MIPEQKFEVELENTPGLESAFFTIPFNVAEAFGSRGVVKVKGTLDGMPFRNSLFPRGKGIHYMIVNKPLREAMGKTAGDRVKVVLDVDLEERFVTVPEDVKQSLQKQKKLKDYFDSLSYSHKKEYVAWIEKAKKPETRSARLMKMMEMLAGKIKNP
jgi:hypothetical protein